MKLSVIKIILVIIALPLIFITAGVTGVTFSIWPTSWPDQQLNISPQKINDLNKLRQQTKFTKQNDYPGAPDERIRTVSEQHINSLLDRLITGLPLAPRKSFVLQHFKITLTALHDYDSEERDQAAQYLDEIMTIVGMQSSNELINVWRYGFPYGWLLPHT